jgi:hypothetical protein
MWTTREMCSTMTPNKEKPVASNIVAVLVALITASGPVAVAIITTRRKRHDKGNE